MNLIRSLLLVTAICLVPAVPASAQDDSFKLPASQSIGFGNLKVHGYKLSGSVSKSKEGPSPGTQLFLTLTRNEGNSTQTHSFFWSKDVKLKLAKDLSGGQVKADLGNFGKLKMHFAPTRDAKTPGPGKGCKGKDGKTRKGQVEGTFKFVPDKDFFGKVKADAIKATAARTPSRTCKSPGTGGGPPGGQPVSLSTTGAGDLNFFADKQGGKVTQTATLGTHDANPVVSHYTTASTSDASKFTVANNASSATAQGFGPWLSGKANFTATDYFTGGASGKVSGPYAVKFDGVGTRKPFAAGDVGGFLSKPGFTPPPPPNEAPSADFSFSEGFSSLDVDFFDDSFDPDGTIVAWAWNFGDGSTSTEQNPSHTYAAAGTYTVHLTVRDEDGATATVAHDVTATDTP
jgi:hypothetical protein